MNGGNEARLLGKWGETLVAKDLRQHGWTIENAGFRCRLGEIDLIASDGTYLAFVEVKLRKNADYGSAASFVDRNKQRKLRAAAEVYLMQFPTALQPRFDVAEIYAPQGIKTREPKINYIENAF